MHTPRVFSMLTILSLMLTLLLAACAAPSAPVSNDPLSLVQRYYDAIEANDIDKAMSFVSDDYVMTDPTGFTVGREAATAAWKGYIDAGFTFDQSDFTASGNRITSCYKVYEKGTLVDEGCGAVTHVRDGKIIFDGLEPAEQIWIVQKFYEATNAGNIAAAMALVAEDAKCRGGCYLNGKEAFRSYVQGSIDLGRGGHVELSDLKVEGDKVTYRWEAYNKDGDLSASGVEALQIQNGQIILMETN